MNVWSHFVVEGYALGFLALVFVQIAVVVAVAWAFARGRSPVLRSKVWVGALIACLVGPPLIGAFELSNTRLIALRILPSAAAAPDARSQTAAAAVDATRERGNQRAVTPSLGSGTAAPAESMLPSGEGGRVVDADARSGAPMSVVSLFVHAFLFVWAGGVLFGLWRIVRSSALVMRLRKTAEPLDARCHADLLDGVARALPGHSLPCIAVSDEVSQPMTLGGAGHPIVLLPRALLQSLSALALRDVLVHECAHVLQRDLRLGWIQSIAHVVFWPHPAVRLLNRELSIAREELCDNYVLAQGRATHYARTLLELSEGSHTHLGALACGLLTPRWSIEKRVADLLDTGRSRRVRMGSAATVAVLGSLISAAGVMAGTRLDRVEPARVGITAEGGQVGVVSTDGVPIKGRVFSPDGKPASGIAVQLHPHRPPDEKKDPLTVRTDAEGRFAFEVEDGGQAFFRFSMVVAKQAGVGLAFAPLSGFRGAGGKLQLVDDVAVEGRIVNLEGQPVAAVSIRVAELRSNVQRTTAPWLAALKKKGVGFSKVTYAELPLHLRLYSRPEFLSATSGKDGRFSLPGIGGERLATLRLSGGGIVSQQIYVVTRKLEPFQQNRFGMGPAWGIAQVYGHRFEHIAAPTRVIHGTVRNRKTQEPLAGVMIQTFKFAGGDQVQWVSTTTDAKGAFRLSGMPKGEGNRIRVTPAAGQPCFEKELVVPDPAGTEPVNLEIELQQGIPIPGRVIDKKNNRGVAATIYALRTNSFGMPRPIKTAADGSFRVVVKKGVVFLGAVIRERSNEYLTVSQFRDTKEWSKELKGSLSGAVLLPRFNAVARLDVDSGNSKTVELEAVQGLLRKLRFLDDQGKPLTKVRVGYANASGWNQPSDDDHRMLAAGAPGWTYGLIFQHRVRKLAGFLKLSDELPAVVDVVLTPWARIEGRLVGKDGKPRSGEKLTLRGFAGTGAFTDPSAAESLHTDKDGRFVIEGLVPDIKYQLMTAELGRMSSMRLPSHSLFKDLVVEAGETRKLGDLESKGTVR